MGRAVKNPRTCPHCGKPVARAPKPRDLGLLLHALCYRVPVHVQEITPEIIEVARKHCRMTPERLEELRGPDFARFWDYMLDRRKRRLEYMRETGEVPAYGWTPRNKGEPDHEKAVLAMHIYRTCAAKVKKHIRKGSTVYDDRISQHWKEAQRLNGPVKVQAYDEILTMIHLHTKAASGKPLNTHEILFIDEKLGTGLKRIRKGRRKERAEKKISRKDTAMDDEHGEKVGDQAPDEEGES